MMHLCVFCGSAVGQDEIYAETARRLGHRMAERDLGLVFGAGHIGLMGILADAVLERNGKAIGVIPQALVDRELAHSGLTELIVVESMHQRKKIMSDRANGFLAMPGGLGTGDELFEILTWAQLRIHSKPIGLLNVSGYFDPLLAWIDHAIGEGFVRPSHRDLFLVRDDPVAILEGLIEQMDESYQRPGPPLEPKP